MGIVDSLFKSTRIGTARLNEEPRYMEVNWNKESGEGRSFVRVVNLNDNTDVDVVLEYLRDRRNLVILKVKPRLIQDKMELKRALKRIQRTAAAIGGDIAGIKEDVILITPPDIEIWRGEHPVVSSVAGTSEAEPAA